MSHASPTTRIAGAVMLCVSMTALPASADEAGEASEASLAMQLSNPVAALISVPLQLNYDQDIGPADDGDRWLLNVQPVIPFELNDDWNLISRTILPVVRQSDIFPGAGTQTGIGDVVQSIFFSPKAPTASGWIWGAGPVLLLPTGSNDLLTTDKWGAGPTAVVLKQSNGWTRGVLANHVWSFAGDDDRADVNATFLQPFLTYTTPTQWTFAFNTESSYDWENEQWSVPVNANVSRLMRFGTQLVSLGGGVRYWLDSPDSGAEGFGLRLTVTLLFPGNCSTTQRVDHDQGTQGSSGRLSDGCIRGDSPHRQHRPGRRADRVRQLGPVTRSRGKTVTYTSRRIGALMMAAVVLAGLTAGTAGRAAFITGMYPIRTGLTSVGMVGGGRWACSPTTQRSPRC